MEEVTVKITNLGLSDNPLGTVLARLQHEIKNRPDLRLRFMDLLANDSDSATVALTFVKAESSSRKDWQALSDLWWTSQNNFREWDTCQPEPPSDLCAYPTPAVVEDCNIRIPIPAAPVGVTCDSTPPIDAPLAYYELNNFDTYTNSR